MNDAFCKEIMLFLSEEGTLPVAEPSWVKEKHLFFLSEEGTLYRRESTPLKSRRDSEVLQLVTPSSYKILILQAMHDDMLSGHLGYQKTYERIRKQFFWPNMSTEIKKYCEACTSCALFKSSPHLRPAPLRPDISPEAPWERVAMDIMGPLNRTARGNTVILIVTCAFSRYSEAIPLPDQKSETIARAFVENVICRHGMPRELLTDRGTNFLSTLFQNVCKILRIERKLTSSYHPMANGGAENMVKCVKNLISHYINDHHDNWDEFIPFVLFAHRTAVQASILESPFYLNHFRDPLIPLDLLVNSPTPLHHCEPKDYKSQMILRMQNAFELTRNNILQARNIQKKNYDKNTTETFFKIGDRVFLSTVAIKTGQTKKFTPKWSGPYRILDKISDILYKLDLHDSKAHPYG